MSEPNLVLGAVDSLALALANHGHSWTDGERAIYEHAIGTLTGKSIHPWDAQLIAAAPDLLNALNGTLSWLTSYPGEGALKAYDQACAAIAKATGKGGSVNENTEPKLSTSAQLEWLWENCHIVYWPRPESRYPIEHNPYADKLCREHIEAEMLADCK